MIQHHPLGATKIPRTDPCKSICQGTGILHGRSLEYGNKWCVYLCLSLRHPLTRHTLATTSRSRASSSSSSASEGGLGPMAPAQFQGGHASQSREASIPPLGDTRSPGDDSDGSVSDEDEREDRVPPVSMYSQSQTNRPPSSLSLHRYRTPMIGSFMTSPPPSLNANVPPVQPLPSFHTQSAFEEVPRQSATPMYPPTNVTSVSGQTASSRSDVPSLDMFAASRATGGYRVSSQPQLGQRLYALSGGGAVTHRPPSRPALEQAVESVQAHLAALTERLELLEHTMSRSATFSSSFNRTRSPTSRSPDGTLHRWDLNDMGMWSLVLKPLFRVVALFERLMDFLAHNENRTPTLVVVRRLFLDISFLLIMLALLRAAWRKSGLRRRKVLFALRGLWSAIVGTESPRLLVDRAV